MFESFFSVLATMVANKKVLGAWLVLLTMSLGAVGDSVYRKRPLEMMDVNNKLDRIESILSDIKDQQKLNTSLLNDIKIEQAKVRTELDLNGKNGKK